jgi:MFS superfamily sulfate permease-like transporter
MQQLPTTSLVGVMFLIAYTAFEWESLLMILGAAMPRKWRESSWWSQWTIRKITRVDALCIILVVVVTLLMDLFTGVAAGIVLVSVAYCWQVRVSKSDSR